MKIWSEYNITLDTISYLAPVTTLLLPSDTSATSSSGQLKWLGPHIVAVPRDTFVDLWAVTVKAEAGYVCMELRMER